MPKWYVEFRSYGKPRYAGGIEAKDGNAAIQWVRDNFMGATSFKVWHDDEPEEEREE